MPIFFICILLVSFVALELSHRNVYGGMISESELDAYFSKYFGDYEINDMARGSKMFGVSYEVRKENDLPYLSRGGAWIFSAWYIAERGTIPRWSKWSKRLDERYEQLTNEGKGVKKIVPLSEL